MTTDQMAKPDTGVYLRGGSTRWQWRIKVPIDLLPFYASEWACRCSLGTSDLRIANARAAQLRAKWLAKFEQQRQPHAAKVERFDAEDAKNWAALVLHDILATDNEIRNDPAFLIKVVQESGSPLGKDLDGWNPLYGLPYQIAQALKSHHAGEASALREQLATGNLMPMFKWLRETASSAGIEFDENTPGLRELLRECLISSIDAADKKLMRDKGSHIPTPQALSFLPQASTAHSLDEVFQRWLNSEGTKLRRGTVQARRKALDIFKLFAEHQVIEKLTRDDGDLFKAWLQEQPFSPKTASDRFKYVKSLLGFAETQLGWIENNPWKHINLGSKPVNRRENWSIDELNRLLALPLFSQYQLPARQRRSGGEAAYWIPILGIFTGARLAELCQLQVADIREEGQGTWLIDINSKNEKRLKTESSVRRIPVHTQLISLGFIEYKNKIQDKGEVNLWPDLKIHPERPSHAFSLWFSESPRKAAKTRDFHSLRHTVETELLEAGVDQGIRDRLLGHALRGSEGNRTYSHPKAALRQGIEALSFKGLKIVRAYPHPELAVATEYSAKS